MGEHLLSRFAERIEWNNECKCTVQGWAKGGLQLWVRERSLFILVLLIIVLFIITNLLLPTPLYSNYLININF